MDDLYTIPTPVPLVLGGTAPVSGNDGWVLTEDSGAPGGTAWAAAPGGAPSMDDTYNNSLGDATILVDAGPIELTASGSTGGPTGYIFAVSGSNTVQSDAAAVWRALYIRPTVSLSGSTAVTTATGFNMVHFAAPVITDGATVPSILIASTVYIAGAPVGNGLIITNMYSFWIDDGLTRLDGSLQLAGADTQYYESTDGQNAAVSGAATGRIRYNNATGKFQASVQGGAYANLDTGSTDTLAWHKAGDSLAGDAIFGDTNTGGAAIKLYIGNAEFGRIIPTYRNLVLGRTTDWDENGVGGSDKYLFQMTRNHAQSTYCIVTNSTDASHSTAGYVASSVDAELYLGALSPSDGFGDVRVGNDCYLIGGSAPNASGSVANLVIMTEKKTTNVPIKFAPNNVLTMTIDQNGSAQGLITVMEPTNFAGGSVNFEEAVTTSDYLSLNSKPQLRGVASPDGGQNSIETTACHLQLGKGISDSATLRGLLFQKNDGTVFGEFGGYHNGLPQFQFYLNGLSGSHIMYDMTNDGTKKMGWFGTSPVAKQTSGAYLTNSVTSGGTDDTIANFTDLTTYANDAAAIRNDIYQLARKLKQLNDGLRDYGLFT